MRFQVVTKITPRHLSLFERWHDLQRPVPVRRLVRDANDARFEASRDLGMTTTQMQLEDIAVATELRSFVGMPQRAAYFMVDDGGNLLAGAAGPAPGWPLVGAAFSKTAAVPWAPEAACERLVEVASDFVRKEAPQ